MKTAQDYLDGQLLLIDKPLEWTSFQVVNKLRWHIRQAYSLKKIKVGHAGTLDPLAEGVLPIALGEATKTVSLIHLLLKSYLFEIQWGSETDTLDLEGKVTKSNEIYPTKKEVQNILKKLQNPLITMKLEDPVGTHSTTTHTQYGSINNNHNGILT